MSVGDRDHGGELETGLRGLLYRFNVEATGIDDGEMLVVTVRDDDGETVAGLFGWTWGGTCFVDLLYVDEDRRGQGLGRAIMTALEQEARDRGCRQIVLATHDFQAPGFYATLGFVEVGRFADYPVGGAQLLLAKQLT